MKTPLHLVPALLLACSPVLATITTYPEYEAAIPRDTAYRVSVAQDGVSKEIPVYNRTEKSILNGRVRGGDVNRRFCEFAFDGSPVTVRIAVSQDVASYRVFPSRLELPNDFKDGVISVTLTEPCNFGIMLNDYEKTILSVFADAPEAPKEIPEKGAPGVLYVDRWLDAPGRDGVLEAGPEIKDIYIAPGAVLNARLVVKGKGAVVHGRGMILDPLSDIFRYDQTANTKRGLLIVGAPEVTVRDVKLVDARTFNYICSQPNVRFKNVKALAAMMCSDGITAGGTGFVCDGAWLYVGDNALVLSGCKDFVISNAVLGTSCAAIFPQGSPAGRLVNTDVFRCDDGFLNNTYNGVLRRNNKWNEMNAGAQRKEPGPQDLKHQTCTLVFDSTSCADCPRFSHVFLGRNMGSLPKNYVFNGLVVPESLGRYDWRIKTRSRKAFEVEHDSKRYLDTDNYSVTINGLWIDGKPVATLDPELIRNPERLNLSVNAPDPAAPCPPPVDEPVSFVNWRNPAPSLPAAPADPNLVREIWPRQSVWQRVPSWLVKLETENGTDPANRIYKLVQCEKGAGMQCIMTDEAIASGRGRYRLTFEASAEMGDGTTEIAFDAWVRSNDWRVDRSFSVGNDWKAFSIDFDLPIDRVNDDLVALALLATRPADVVRFRNMRFVKLPADALPPQTGVRKGAL